MKNYYYLKDFIKTYAILNKEKNLTQLGIIMEIENKYGKLNINKETINKQDIDKKTIKFKKNTNSMKMTIFL